MDTMTVGMRKCLGHQIFFILGQLERVYVFVARCNMCNILCPQSLQLLRSRSFHLQFLHQKEQSRMSVHFLLKSVLVSFTDTDTKAFQFPILNVAGGRKQGCKAGPSV